MRDGLLPYRDKRMRFRATFVRKNQNPKVSLLLFKDLERVNGEFLSDHIWLDKVHRLRNLNLKQGDVIEFGAIVVLYFRLNGTSDLKLTDVEKVRKVAK